MNELLQKRLVRLCRLLRTHADETKVLAAAAEVRDAYWRFCRGLLARVSEPHIRGLGELERFVLGAPLANVVDGCMACVAAGRIPDTDIAGTWFCRSR